MILLWIYAAVSLGLGGMAATVELWWRPTEDRRADGRGTYLIPTFGAIWMGLFVMAFWPLLPIGPICFRRSFSVFVTRSPNVEMPAFKKAFSTRTDQLTVSRLRAKIASRMRAWSRSAPSSSAVAAKIPSLRASFKICGEPPPCREISPSAASRASSTARSAYRNIAKSRTRSVIVPSARSGELAGPQVPRSRRLVVAGAVDPAHPVRHLDRYTATARRLALSTAGTARRRLAGFCALSLDRHGSVCSTKTRDARISLKNFGKTSLREVRAKLAPFGLRLAGVTAPLPPYEMRRSSWCCAAKVVPTQGRFMLDEDQGRREWIPIVVLLCAACRRQMVGREYEGWTAT